MLCWWHIREKVIPVTLMRMLAVRQTLLIEQATLCRLPDCQKEKALEMGYGSVATIAKNRNYGDIGKIALNFEKGSKRFICSGMVDRYGWEDL